MRLALCAIVFPILAAPQEANACVPVDAEITDHAIDPAYAGDTTPPPAPQVDVQIARRDTGGGCTSTDCDGQSANIYIDITAGDDMTPAARMGYILTISGGDTPTGLYSRAVDGMPYFQPHGSFGYGFDYNASDFAFDVEVRAIDLNGNISAPTIVHIADKASSGCSMSGSSSQWLLLPVLGFVLRRRRRRGCTTGASARRGRR